MKTMGLIGGMSRESTVTYYRIINQTMKRLILAGLVFIMKLILAACEGNHFFHADTGYYSNFMAKGEGREYEISGSAQVVDRLSLLYISAIEDTDVNLSGELKLMSGELQIVYINEDNEETKHH